MNIHEYQAKAILKEFGAPVSPGVPIVERAAASAAAAQLEGPLYVVKSQIYAGGRGKGTFKEAEAGSGGGVRLARSAEEVVLYAEQMLGKTLVTVQTGPSGKVVNRLYIEDGSAIEKGSISRFSSIEEPAAWPSSSRPRAVSRSKKWRIRTPKRS